jgi:hypothetical protein
MPMPTPVRLWAASVDHSWRVANSLLDWLAEFQATDRDRMDGAVLVVDPRSCAIITVLQARSPKGRRHRRQRNGRPDSPRRRRSHWHLWRRLPA